MIRRKLTPLTPKRLSEPVMRMIKMIKDDKKKMTKT